MMAPRQDRSSAFWSHSVATLALVVSGCGGSARPAEEAAALAGSAARNPPSGAAEITLERHNALQERPATTDRYPGPLRTPVDARHANFFRRSDAPPEFDTETTVIFLDLKATAARRGRRVIDHEVASDGSFVAEGLPWRDLSSRRMWTGTGYDIERR